MLSILSLFDKWIIITILDHITFQPKQNLELRAV